MKLDIMVIIIFQVQKVLEFNSMFVKAAVLLKRNKVKILNLKKIKKLNTIYIDKNLSKN